jgi:hypothetical protein
MEELPAQPWQPQVSGPVDWIAHYRMADGCQVDAYLVHAAGLQANFQHSCPRQPSDRPIVRPGRLAGFGNSLSLSITGVPAYGRLDNPRGRSDVARDEDRINAIHMAFSDGR